MRFSSSFLSFACTLRLKSLTCFFALRVNKCTNMCLPASVCSLSLYYYIFWQSTYSDISTCNRFLWHRKASVCFIGTNLLNDVSILEIESGASRAQNRCPLTRRGCYRFKCSCHYCTVLYILYRCRTQLRACLAAYSSGQPTVHALCRISTLVQCDISKFPVFGLLHFLHLG